MITQLCGSAERRCICMAYLGRAAAELLPAQSGDLIVVDASRRALESGTTNPHAIEQWLGQDVKVVSLEGLHAKIVVADGMAFIGSSNASTNSAARLFEASLTTDDPIIVSQAVEYIKVLAAAGLMLGDEWLRTEAIHFRPGPVVHLEAGPPQVQEGDEVVWILEGTDRKRRYHRHSACYSMRQWDRPALPMSRRAATAAGRTPCGLDGCWLQWKSAD